MITKIGADALADTGAFLLGPMNAFRAARNSDAEAAALKLKYGLDPDTNLNLRNAGRGVVGGLLGSVGGGIIGAGLGGLTGDPAIAGGLGALGSLGGGIAGTWIGGNKYSQGAGREALLAQQALA